MDNAFLLSACRTPIGRFHGGLSALSATDLGAIVVRKAVDRAGVDATEVDEVILGQVLTAGVGQAPARQAALKGGLPASVAALTINKVCGSGLKAVMQSSQAVRSGDAQIVVAGGMESMSRAGWILPREAEAFGDRNLIDSLLYDGLTCAHSGRSMGEIAEQLAQQADISRVEQDGFALESHRRAVGAMETAAFTAEVVPVSLPGREESTVAFDEGPRSDTNLKKLAALSPAFQNDGTVTAGNAPMISDGAAAVVVASEEVANRTDVRPLLQHQGAG